MATKKTATGKELIKVEVVQAERDLSKQMVQAARGIVVKAQRFVSPKAIQGCKTYIGSQDELTSANALMTELQAHIKTIESKRKQLTQPFVDGKRQLDEFFNGPKNELQQWLDDLKEAARQHLIRVEAKRREEEAAATAKLAEKQQKLDEKLEQAKADGNEKAIARIEQQQQELAETIAAPKTAAAELGNGVGTRKKFRFTVVDFAKMPDSFQGFQLKVANTSVLQKIADDSEGQAEVPGVVFEEDFGIVVQAKK